MVQPTHSPKISVIPKAEDFRLQWINQSFTIRRIKRNCIHRIECLLRVLIVSNELDLRLLYFYSNPYFYGSFIITYNLILQKQVNKDGASECNYFIFQHMWPVTLKLPTHLVHICLWKINSQLAGKINKNTKSWTWLITKPLYQIVIHVGFQSCPLTPSLIPKVVAHRPPLCLPSESKIIDLSNKSTYLHISLHIEITVMADKDIHKTVHLLVKLNNRLHYLVWCTHCKIKWNYVKLKLLKN